MKKQLIGILLVCTTPVFCEPVFPRLYNPECEAVLEAVANPFTESQTEQLERLRTIWTGNPSRLTSIQRTLARANAESRRQFFLTLNSVFEEHWAASHSHDEPRMARALARVTEALSQIEPVTSLRVFSAP